MQSKFSFLIWAAMTGVTMSAKAQNAPNPSEIFIRDLQYSGAACPPNTVSSSISADAKAFTLLFNQFSLSGTLATATVATGCDLVINMEVPSGWSYSLFSLDYRGFADLQPGTQLNTRAIYAFDGMPQVQIGTNALGGPYQDDFFLRNLTPLESISYSTCDGSIRPLRLSSKISMRGAGYANVDSFDGALVHQYGIAWRKCPAISYRIPSVLTCSYKTFAGNNTIHGMIQYDANLHNPDPTQNGLFFQRRTTGAEERATGHVEGYFWITDPLTNMRKKFYFGDTIAADPSKPIMGVLEYHVPANPSAGIRENIWDTRTSVDIRRYFGVGEPVKIQSATPGNTGYWPIGLSGCVQNASATWPRN